MEKSTFERKLECRDCRFSDKLVQDGGGPGQMGNIVTICRFSPPIVAHAFMPTGPGSGQVISQSLWPVMALGDWCGKLETRSN